MNTSRSYISESLLNMGNVDSSDVLIEEFLKENYNIEGSYTIKDGTVDVKGNVKVINRNITQLTNGLFRFGKVSGMFNCSNCKSLKTLEGAPQIASWFDCSNCKSLTSLEGAPKKIEGSFFCNDCVLLTSLKGAPLNVGKDFDCSYCESLTSLEGTPEVVGGNFCCSRCGKQFTKTEVTAICKVNGNIK